MRAILLVVFFAGACGFDRVPPVGANRVPADPSLSTITTDRTMDVVANGVDSVVVTVTVLDADGNPLSDRVVSLGVTLDAVTSMIDQPTATTDDAGVATGTLRSTKADLIGVTATIDPDGPSVDLSQHAMVQFVPGRASRILVLSGDGQSGSAGAVLAPLVAAVTDDTGNPIAGSPLSFTLTRGDGMLSVDSDTADSAGRAKTTLTLGMSGVDTVVATSSSVAGASAEFGAVALDVAPSSSLFTNGPADQAVGDMNGDGKPDIVTVRSTVVAVFVNSTTPGVTPVTYTEHDTSVSSPTQFVSLGDLNGDGRLDLVIVTTAGLKIQMNTTSAGATTPSFSAETTVAALLPQKVTLADLNGDGRLDLVAANAQAAGTVSVFLNVTVPGSNTAAFATHAELATGAAPLHVAVGDFNGDGMPDLAVPSAQTNAVSILLNNTTAGSMVTAFAAKVDVPTSASPGPIVVGDFNGDGLLDLATTSTTGASVLLNTTAPGASAPTFAAKIDFPTGQNPSRIVVRDVNGDGRPDLSLLNNSPDTVSVLLDTTPPGGTTVSFATKVDISTTSSAYGLEILDFNADGMPDFFVLLGFNASTILNTTAVVHTRTYSPGSVFATATTGHPIAAVLRDVNGDGKPDLIVANFENFSVSVLRNETAPGARSPTFGPALNVPAAAATWNVAVGDLNGDGKPDLVTTASGNSQISVSLNNTTPGGDPTFRPKIDFDGNASGGHGVSLGDINGDGKLDIVTADNGAVLLNTTPPGAITPSFSAKIDLATGVGIVNGALADINGDGRLDLVLADGVMLNTTTPGATTPTFGAKVTFTAPASPFTMAVADINADGKPDVVVAAGTVSVLFNTSTAGTTTPTFFKQDLDNSGARGIALGDLDGDGKPDIVAGNQSGSMSVFFNTGGPGATTPTFSARTDYPVPSQPVGPAIGDLNGDGRNDIVVTSLGGGNASIFFAQ